MNPAAASDEKKTAAKASAPALVVVTGNPNCGKTTLFNALTGLRAKVGNYAGVTVERKEGRLLGTPPGTIIRVLDLPGTYSLSPNSLDEQISRDVLLNRLPELPPPDLIVVVVDASNLQRNLYYATQVIELGHPTILALNMVDVAEANGHAIDTVKLSKLLGVPVLPIVATSGQGLPQLREKILSSAQNTVETKPELFCQLPGLFRIEAMNLSALLAETFRDRQLQATAEALLILSNEKAMASSGAHYPQKIEDAVAAARKRLEAHDIDWRGAPIEWRYSKIAEIQRAVTTETAPPGESFSDRLDCVLTHKIWGTAIFIAVMWLMFQSIFTFAQYPMDGLQWVVSHVGGLVGGWIPPGDLNDLLVNGVIAGVGAVVVFLPQILLLFLFIGFLEDTGYMARAAFLMDRLMSKVGLHGKSFIPMLSSFACAIPGIMATRTIESRKDRLVTILVAPLMSCSARLPVYTLLIAACIPDIKVLGFVKLAGLTMLSMYLLGIIVALLMAWLFKKTLLKGETPMLIMELPPYKRPLLKTVLQHMWDRSRMFLRRAGTVILGINILLWFLATYPKGAEIEKEFSARRAAVTDTAQLAELSKEESGAKLRNSFAGHMGRAIEPVIAPLGFDWKMGIGIISSFAAREVFVSTMSTVYNVGNDDSDAGTKTLAENLRAQKRTDGSAVYTPLVAVTLMVFYVLAMQCASTVVVVRRETNSWKWPVFQWLYMGALAWVLAFITYQGGRLLGLG
jgi:ferrous iron transport protein B